jgi:hypothetical protein
MRSKSKSPLLFLQYIRDESPESDVDVLSAGLWHTEGMTIAQFGNE